MSREPVQPILRECRVVWNFVIKIELAEPPISKVQFDLLAQPALMPDAVTVSDNQHPDHETRDRPTDGQCRCACTAWWASRAEVLLKSVSTMPAEWQARQLPLTTSAPAPSGLTTASTTCSSPQAPRMGVCSMTLRTSRRCCWCIGPSVVPERQCIAAAPFDAHRWCSQSG